MITYLSPLRYPGGKARFAPFISKLMKDNGLSGHYLEPYAGGAGVALRLLFDGIVTHIHINDIDTAIYDFWISATQRTEELLRLIHDTPIDMSQWYHWRSVLRGEIEATQSERGFATLFMNRTNRSGILKGGVIGGYKQNGAYTLDVRFKKIDIRKRIEAIGKVSSQISVYNEDALALLGRSQSILPAGSLIYLDPPYYVKGQGLYRNYYKHQDHVAIAEYLSAPTFQIPWIVSYDNVEQIRDMYKVARALTYSLRYSAQRQYIGSEIMFFSSNIRVPSVEIPAVA